MVVGTEDKQPDAADVSEAHTDAEILSAAPTAHEEARSSPSVRFQSTVEQIDIVHTSDTSDNGYQDHSPDSIPDELRTLTNAVSTAHLQGLRIASFAYEPVSLPASRTVSHEDGSSHHPSRQHTPNSTTGSQSPMLAAKAHDVQSPPLTPLGTSQVDGDAKSPKVHTDIASPHTPRSPRSPRHGAITPQESSTREASPLRPGLPIQRPASSGDIPHRQASSSDINDSTQLGNHRQGLFSIGTSSPGGTGGPAGGSLSVSRESSSSEKSASQFYSRPFTPSGDANDPYAANKRPPQNKIEPRFVFSRLSRRKDTSPTSSSVSLSKYKEEKRHSGLLGGHHHHHHRSDHKDDNPQHEESSAPSLHSRQGSMSDLKRFFKLGPSHHHKIKRAVSPAVSIRSARSGRSCRHENSTASRSNAQIPFGDEHALTSKYGKLGKVLGSGAGGSVRLMKRSEDSTVFAVKEFRARHAYETEKEYVKKLTAEYCIGSSLHHGNIIETLDIISEKGKWYEVMEYAPYDLFAIVMTGRMTRPEVACCFLQILSGVTYLHSMGLAHRDLKLDNVVVSGHGIMKIIDFGSAHVFQYPFENGIVLASGIVGSDPYLAPEVYDERKYNPTAVDIWSLAIIFCCMTLRRFPWKVPRLTDNSYKLFASEPTPGHDPMRLNLGPSKAASGDDVHHHTKAEEEKASSTAKDAAKDHGPVEEVQELEPKPVGDDHHEEEEKDGKDDKNGASGDKSEKSTEKSSDKASEKPAEKKEVIKGPWRILRLLPRESRHVIGGMLKIDPKDRIKMSEVLKDPWVANTIICRQIQPGKVTRPNTHTHVLESPTPPMK